MRHILFILSLACLICWHQKTRAQWTDNSSSIITEDKVGIKVSNPEANFHLYGMGLIEGTTQGRLMLRNIDDNTWHISSNIPGVHSKGFAIFSEEPASNSTNIPFVITHLGKVGIGTPTPDTRLSVYDRNPIISLESPSAGQYFDNDGSNDGWLGIRFKAADVKQGPPVSKWNFTYSARDDDLYFYSYTQENKIVSLQDSGDVIFTPNGNVGIGTSSPTTKLAVNGTTQTKEIIVTEQAGDWPDYVFSDAGYRLPELVELEAFIQTHKHLPGIPTKKEIERDGQNLGAIQAKLLERIEELTLYVIELEKRDRSRLARIEALERKLQQLSK